ncbi:MAG: hypothetical protein AB8B85_13750 [Paracoccaceae bacterium]
MTQNEYRSTITSAPAFEQITPEMIDYYIKYGNHLRAATLASYTKMLGDRIARLWGGGQVTPKPASETVSDRFANSLTAIRSSAEILRDTPELDAPERARFVAIVLEEERRLARALDALPGLPAQTVPGR